MEYLSNEALVPLVAMAGTWKGEGQGRFPTIEPFAFRSQMSFQTIAACKDEPLVHFEEVALVENDGEFSFKHWETGFFRIAEGGVLEMQVTHNTGRIEILRGTYDFWNADESSFELTFSSSFLHNAPGLTEAMNSERRWVLENGVLHCEHLMSTKAIGQLNNHLIYVLQKT